MNRRKAIRYLRRIRKKRIFPKRRIGNKGIRIIKLIAAFLLIVLFHFCIGWAQIAIAKRVPGESDWAIAFIAIPIAVLAIAISVHIAFVRKDGSYFCESYTEKRLRRQTIHGLLDFRLSLGYLFFGSFIQWIGLFLRQDADSRISLMLTHSLFMVFYAAVFAGYELIQLSKSSSYYASKFVLLEMKEKERKYDTAPSYRDYVKSIVANKENHIEISTTGYTLFDDSGLLATIAIGFHTGHSTFEQKEAIEKVLNQIGNSKLSVNNILESCFLFRYIDSFYKELLETEEYAFAIKLFRTTTWMTLIKRKQALEAKELFSGLAQLKDYSDHLTMAEQRDGINVVASAAKDLLIIYEGLDEMEEILNKQFEEIAKWNNNIPFSVLKVISDIADNIEKNDYSDIIVELKKNN